MDERPGVDYSEAKKRVKRIALAPGNPQAKCNLINSIINQATVREGEKAKSSLLNLAHESSTLSGRGIKQTGVGPGKKLGPGRWVYVDGGWKRG